MSDAAPRRRPVERLRGSVQEVVRAVPLAIDTYFARRLGQNASAVAYRMLVALAPLAIVLVAIFGLVLRDEELQARVIDWVVEFLPFDEASRQEVENAIVAIASPASLIGFLGLLAFAWTATGVMTAIRLGLEVAFDVKSGRPAVHGKLVDALLVVSTALLVVLLVLMSTLASLAEKAIAELGASVGLALGGTWLSVVMTLLHVGLTVGIVLALFRFVPARHVATRHALAGAVATALMLVAIAVASSAVIGRTSDLSAVYGSLTTVFAFLYSVYLAACALLIGACFAWALGEPPGPPGPPLLVQIREALLGLVRRPPEQHEPPGRGGDEAGRSR